MIPAAKNFDPSQSPELLEGWMLGQINSVRPHDGGSSGAQKFVIDSAEGRFLLKGRPVGSLSPGRLELMRQVTADCIEAGVPVADFRPQADGQRHVQWGGFVWELQSWISGRNGRRASDDAISSGIALAMFHRATRQRQGPIEKGYHHRQDLDKLARLALSHAPQAESALCALVTVAKVARSKVQDRGIAVHRKQALHGDWHPRNLRFNAQGQVCGILDLDAVRTDAVATELATAVLHVSLRRSRDTPTEHWPEGLRYKAGQRLTSAWRSRIGQEPGLGTWGMLPWLMIEALAFETILPIAVRGEIAGIDPAAWIQAGAKSAEWIRERSRALADCLAPKR